MARHRIYICDKDQVEKVLSPPKVVFKHKRRVVAIIFKDGFAAINNLW